MKRRILKTYKLETPLLDTVPDKGNFHNPLGNGSRGTKVLDIAHREYNDYLYTVKTENNCIFSILIII